jgi:hypothetical protein
LNATFELGIIMKRISFLAVCVPILGLATASLETAYAGCEALTGRALSDKQLWINFAGDWRDFNQISELPQSGQRKIAFIYVIRRSETDANSTGAVVIKSGIKNIAGGVRGPDTVHLVRDQASAKAYCEMTKNSELFTRRTVNKKAYDEYHDYDFEDDRTSGGAEFATTIRDFHVGLKHGSPAQCVRTDSSTDSSGQWIPRNVRSQFSFDQNIVDGGMSPHYATAGRFIMATLVPSVLAGGSDGFNSQRSEIKSYEIRDGLACVRFFASVARRDFILRINDLGARMAGSLFTETRWER